MVFEFASNVIALVLVKEPLTFNSESLPNVIAPPVANLPLTLSCPYPPNDVVPVQVTSALLLTYIAEVFAPEVPA